MLYSTIGHLFHWLYSMSSQTIWEWSAFSCPYCLQQCCSFFKFSVLKISDVPMLNYFPPFQCIYLYFFPVASATADALHRGELQTKAAVDNRVTLCCLYSIWWTRAHDLHVLKVLNITLVMWNRQYLVWLMGLSCYLYFPQIHCDWTQRATDTANSWQRLIATKCILALKKRFYVMFFM